MDEYGIVFGKALHAKLKEKIKAGILVKVNSDDEVVVEIIRDRQVDYTYIIDNFSIKFLHGYSTDIAAYEIVSAYRKCILNRYFA